MSQETELMDEHRLRAESELLHRLAAASGGIVSVAVSPTLRHYTITLNVAAPVGIDEHYTIERTHQLSLVLPDDFPAQGPLPRLSKPILAPNIWPTGVPCIVENSWMPSQSLDQVVCDIVEEMQGLAPNYESVANPTADRLYHTPGFADELRRKLGPPVRLVPPDPPRSAGGIRTVGGGTGADIATAGPEGRMIASVPAPGIGITTVGSLRS